MGGSMTVEILGRNNIKAEKAFIDAAFIVKMNPVMAKIYNCVYIVSNRSKTTAPVRWLSCKKEE